MSTLSALQPADQASPARKGMPYPATHVRLIPGMAASGSWLSVTAGKKPQSVRSDPRSTAEAPERLEVDHHTALQSLAQVLPRPQDLSSHSNLAAWVVTDIAIVLATAGFALTLLRPDSFLVRARCTRSHFTRARLRLPTGRLNHSHRILRGCVSNRSSCRRRRCSPDACQIGALVHARSRPIG